MKIGIDTRYSNSFSGIGNYVDNLVFELEQTYVNNQYIPFKTDKRQWLLWEQFLLPLRTIRKNLDLFFFPNWRVPYFFNTPYVVTIHDITPIRCREMFPSSLKSRLFKTYLNLIRRTIYNSEHVITVSEFSKNDIIDFFKVDESKISVIHNGINPTFFLERDDDKKKLIKKKYKIKKPFVLYVGRFDPNKNVSSLINAYSNLKQKNDLDCILIGDITKEQLTNLMNLTSERKVIDNVLILKKIPTDELPYFYQLAEMLVFPSIYEGFGLPVIEAMACCCPVVASNTTSIPEVLDNCGLLFDPLSVEQITLSMSKLLSSTELKKTLVKKGLNRAKLFSWKLSAIKHQNIFNNLIH
jgi:hypothetical protein